MPDINRIDQVVNDAQAEVFQGGGQVEDKMLKLEGLNRDLNDLNADISALLRDIAMEMQNAPKQGPEETPEDFQKRQEAFQTKIDGLNDRLADLQGKLKSLESKIPAAERAVTTAQNDQADKLREAVKKQNERFQTEINAATGGDSRASESDGYEERVQVVKQEVTRDGLKMVQLAVQVRVQSSQRGTVTAPPPKASAIPTGGEPKPVPASNGKDIDLSQIRVLAGVSSIPDSPAVDSAPASEGPTEPVANDSEA